MSTTTSVVPKKVSRIVRRVVETTPVYDIEVPVYDNFVLANGLIVHNSKDLADGLTGALWGASQYELSEQMRHAEEDVILTSELMNSPEDSMELATKHILGMDMETRVLNDFSDVFSLGGDDILDW